MFIYNYLLGNYMKSKIKNGFRKGLGSQGSKLLSLLSSEKKDIFTIKDAKEALGARGGSVAKLLHDLAVNKWITRIERGKYIIIPLDAGLRAEHMTHPFIIGRSLVSPYYIGFLSALNYYGITEQPSQKVFIVTKKKSRRLVFQLQEYVFVRLAKKRFFGLSEEWIGNTKFIISDKEKTIIDCLFILEYSGGLTEVMKAFREKLDYEKLYEYALKMEDVAAIKRLGYLLDIAKIKTPVLGKLLKKVSGGYCLVDTGGPKTGLKNEKWRIIENIPKEELVKEL